MKTSDTKKTQNPPDTAKTIEQEIAAEIRAESDEQEIRKRLGLNGGSR